MLRRDVTAQAESTIDGVYHQRASRGLDGAEKCRHTPRENFVEFTRIAAVATALHAHAYAIAGGDAERRRQLRVVVAPVDVGGIQRKIVRARPVKAAKDAKSAAAAKAKEMNDRAKPKDVTVQLYAQPIRVRVLPPEKPAK